MRRFLWLAIALGLAGDLAAILIGPRWIHYWFAPPVPAGATAAFNCTAALDYGMHNLLLLQLGGSIGGVVIGLLVTILLWRGDRKRAAAQVPAAEPPKPAAK